jgi:hypothetical protein
MIEKNWFVRIKEKNSFTYILFFQTAAKKRKEKEKIHIIIEKLNEELFKQKEHVERVRARLDIEREHWFKNRMLILNNIFLK